MKRLMGICGLLIATAAQGAVPADQPTFGLDNLTALQHILGGCPLWQYLAAAVWVGVALMAAPLIDFVVTRVWKRVALKSDNRILTILARPLKVTVVLLVLGLGLQSYQWPHWVERLLAPAFVIALAGTITFVTLRLVDVLLGYMESKLFGGDPQLAGLMLPVLGKTFKVVVIIIGTLTAAQQLGLPIASIITGLGIGGIAVALAAQNTLANIFGSITILADRPFRVGEDVRIGEIEGKVESIGLRSTRMRTADGHYVTIPNKTVADSAIINISMRPTIRRLITVSLTYDTPAHRVQEAVEMLREIFNVHPMTQDASVYWRDYAASSLDIFIVYWCKSTRQEVFLAALQEINLEIKRRFDAAGLTFAFPTQTIQLQHGDGKPASGT